MAKRLPPRRGSRPEPGTNEPYHGAEMVSDDELDLAPDAESEEEAADTVEDRKERDRKDRIVRRGLKRFKLSSEAYADQRKRELDDLKFARALQKDHWPEAILKARGGQTGDDGGGKEAPPRPCLVIDKLGVPRRQVLNEARSSKMSIHVKAKAGRASRKDAQLVQGGVRAIEVDSKAHIARHWSLDHASICGRAYYRVLTKYANDKDTDLDIVVSRILNQLTVHPDPWHKEPDGSDMQFCLITEDIPRREFPNRYPDSRLAKRILAAEAEVMDGKDPIDIQEGNHTGDELSAEGDTPVGWITEDTIRVAEYFEVVPERRVKLFVPMPDGSTAEQWDDEIPENVKLPGGTKRRTIITPKVFWYVITADELVDEEVWPGRYIPVIQLLGEEYNVDGDRCYKGIVSNGKDSQRSYNYHRSAQVELVGLAPRAPFVAAEGQTEDHPEWETSNTANHAVLVYRPLSLDGNLIGPPVRNTAEPAIQAVTMGAMAADEDIRDTTGRHEGSLGKNPKDQSGKALQAQQQQGQVSTSHYVVNLAEIAMAHEARIIIDLLPKIYDRPGRVMRLLGERDKEEYAIVGQPFVQTPNGPMPMPEGTPEGAMAQGPDGRQRKVKVYKFNEDAEFTITVGVGPSKDTQKEQNAGMVETIMTTVPALAPLVADIYAGQMEGDIGEQLQKRLKAAQPAIAGLSDDDDEDSDMPPEAAAKLQGMQMQIQQMQQALQAAQQELQTKQQQTQAEMAMAREAGESRERIAMLTSKTQIAIARMKGGADVDLEEMDAQLKLALQEAEHAHDRMMVNLEARAKERELGAKVEADRASTGMKLDAAERTTSMKLAADRDRNREKLGVDVAKQRLAEASNRRMSGDQSAAELKRLDREAEHETARVDRQAGHEERRVRAQGDEARRTLAVKPKPEAAKPKAKAKASKN
ncbi:MAG: portal protein [Thermoplasmatota archaeon]